MTPHATAGETAGPAAPAASVTWRSWAVWGIAALFYLTGFYQRVSPAVMTSELMRDFGLGAQSLGSLSAFYFYFYVAMQIPAGVLIDSWGARKLLFWGALSAAGGTFLFGATSNFALACAGRAIIGGATAAGWLVLLKLATHWFPARRFAMLSGLGLFFGNLGALVAQVPLRLLIEHFGWRNVVLGSAVILLGVCALVWLIVRNDPSDAGLESHAPAALRTTKSAACARSLRLQTSLRLPQYLVHLLRPRRHRRPDPRLHRSLGHSLSRSALWTCAGPSRRRLLRNDRLLGSGESPGRRALRQDRPPQTDLPLGRGRRSGGLDRDALPELFVLPAFIAVAAITSLPAEPWSSDSPTRRNPYLCNSSGRFRAPSTSAI